MEYEFITPSVGQRKYSRVVFSLCMFFNPNIIARDASLFCFKLTMNGLNKNVLLASYIIESICFIECVY